MAESVVQRDEEQDEAQGEGSFAYTIGKPIDLATLGQELAAKLELEQEPGMVATGNMKTASPKEPITLWIWEKVNLNTLRGVVNAHEVKVSEWEKLAKKATEGENFTDEEVQTILRRVVIGQR